MTCWPRGLLALGMSLGLTGCFGKGEPPPVVIGHVATLTGPGSTAGEHALRGIRLAVEEMNRDPSKGAGRPIVVHHTDARGDLAAFESEAVRLVAVNRAVALLGGRSAPEVERLERAQVPVLGLEGMHTRGMGPLVFLTGLAPEVQGQVLARFAAQDRGATAAAVLADEGREEALRLAEAFVRAFPAAAAKHKANASIPAPVVWRYSKAAQLEDLARRVREAKSEVLLFAGTGTDLRDLLNHLKQPGLAVLWGGEEPLPSVPGKGERNPIFQATAYSRDADTPQAKTFLEKYRKAFSEDPDANAAVAYDAARLLGEAARRAENSDSPAQIREKLAEIKDFPGLTGPFSFTPDQQLKRHAFVVGLENEGRKQTVKRFDAEP